MNLTVPSGSPFMDSLLDMSNVADGVSGSLIQNVTEQQVLDALAALGRGDIEFVILNDGNRFMQAAGDARSGYILEYNEGSAKEQFRATIRTISDADLTAAFRAYFQNDPTWKTLFSWEKFRI
jgi:hypothetical protein